MGEYSGKVVLVTGSSAGIGRDTAIAFAAKGASVVLHGQSAERLKESERLVKEAGAADVLVVQASLEEDSAPVTIVKKTVEKFGRIDVLVNNAGTVAKKGLDREDLRTLDYLYKVNLRSVVELTQLAIPYLEKTKGVIINVSSIGTLKVGPGYDYYIMLKSSLSWYGKISAVKYAPKGIRVNNVLPGPVKTNILNAFGYDPSEAERVISDRGTDYSLLQRAGEPREVADLILFLSSANFITGQDFVIDGGDSVNRYPPNSG